MRRERQKMSDTLSHKQRVIEAQEHKIAALDATNNRLLAALTSLKERYASQSHGDEDQFAVQAPPGKRIMPELGELKSSSC